MQESYATTTESLPLEVLKRSKYSLLKNEKDLTETQKIKLEAIKENFPNLKKMHELKEEFRVLRFVLCNRRGYKE